MFDSSSDFKELLKLSYLAFIIHLATFELSTLGISEPSDFAKEWTIFYWAWWVAFGPLVGLFIARISKGRSLRQVIIGMLFFGTLGTWLFYLVLGGYSMNGELNNEINVVQNMKDIGHAETAISVITSLS